MQMCSLKVQDQGNGTYRCEKCNMDMDSFNYRIILSFSIADATDNQVMHMDVMFINKNISAKTGVLK